MDHGHGNVYDQVEGALHHVVQINHLLQELYEHTHERDHLQDLVPTMVYQKLLETHVLQLVLSVLIL